MYPKSFEQGNLSLLEYFKDQAGAENNSKGGKLLELNRRMLVVCRQLSTYLGVEVAPII